MKLQLKNRQIDVLKCFIASSTPLDVQFFIDKYNRSERTVRYDITAIREELGKHEIDIKVKSKKGFYIPASQKQQCSQLLLEVASNADMSLIDDSDETRYLTLYLFLLMQKKAVTAEEISQYFFISRSTAIRLLSNFKEYFNNEIQLNAKKSSGYQLAGDEYEIRALAVKLLSKFLKGSYSAEDWYILLPPILKNEITLAKIMVISNAIKKMNTHYNVWISNDAFINLLSYCMIRDLRLYHGEPLMIQNASIQVLGQDYVKDLLLALSKDAQHQGELEIEGLTKVLSENGIAVEYDQHIGVELCKVIDEMIAILNLNERNYPYAFDTMSLYDDLYEHFMHSINKEAKGDDNPLLSEIKLKYEHFFILATDCALAFEHQYHIALSMSEISYIAIYLYKNLINLNSSNKKVLIVCATGKGLSNLLTTRIKNVFQNLTIVGQSSPYQVDTIHHYKDIDFVISTIPLPQCSFPVVKISRILSLEDIQRIQEFLHYGKFIDDIPFNQNASASFNSKADPFDLYEVNTDEDKTSLAHSTAIVSKLIMTLLEYTSKFPSEYQMNQDAILGLVIHLVLAIPRWYTINFEEDNEAIEEYTRFKLEHDKVFILMEKFFTLVEEALLITISVSERYAFFLYIINHE